MSQELLRKNTNQHHSAGEHDEQMFNQEAGPKQGCMAKKCPALAKAPCFKCCGCAKGVKPKHTPAGSEHYLLRQTGARSGAILRKFAKVGANTAGANTASMASAARPSLQ